MTGNEYQELAMKTNSHDKAHFTDMVDNSVYGIIGELGEVVDQIKKSRFQGHELDKAHLKEELGDTLWYITQMCSAFNFDLDDIMEININKLKKRYPEGKFDVERSINRTV